MTRRARLAALATAALAGCPVEPPPCPGEPQATLSFAGALAVNDCTPLVPTGATTLFPATVSFLSDTEAAVCLSRLLTQPRLCARSGDALSACASPPQEVLLSGCPCAVSLQETLSGSLLRNGTRANGFSGALVVALSRSTAAGAPECYAAGDAQGTTGACPAATGGCTARYDLTGSP